MASFVPYRDKNGNIVSYQIQVYRGRDSEGKKLKPYTMSWEVPDGWKESSIKRELDKVAAQFENKCKEGKVPIERKTFKQYSEYFIQIKELENKKHRTLHRYRELLERINSTDSKIGIGFGHLKLSEINEGTLNNFYISLKKPGANLKTGSPLSDQTVIHYHRLVHAILQMAVNKNVLPFNVADKANPPQQPKKEPEFFELDEVLAIREALDKQPLKWKAITCLLIDTGARRGEILGLKWDAVDFKNNIIGIKTTLNYTTEKGTYEDTTKTDKPRKVNIAPEIMSILQAHKKAQLEQKIKLGSYWNDTGYCFTQENGLPMNPDSINKWQREFSDEFNLPYMHPHKFRHTQASLLYAAHENPVAISKRLGHSKISTTQDIYSHLMENGDKAASDKIANLLYRNLEKSIK